MYNVGVDAPTLTAALRGLPVPQIRYRSVTGSTNADALAWAAVGAPDGCLVVADEQTAGRGRLDRRWYTPPGAALAFSLILRAAPSELPHLGLFSPLAGLALWQTLLAYGLPAQIKWPNDVLLAGRKTAGILAEADWTDAAAPVVVLGVGVNVLPESVPPPDLLRFPATCVNAALGAPVDRVTLLSEILSAFFALRPRLGSPQMLQTWQRALAFLGETVYIENQGQPVKSGVLLGVDATGALRLQPPDGPELTIPAGDVSLRPAHF